MASGEALTSAFAWFIKHREHPTGQLKHQLLSARSTLEVVDHLMPAGFGEFRQGCLGEKELNPPVQTETLRKK